MKGIEPMRMTECSAEVREGFEVKDLTTYRNWLWVYEPDTRRVDMYGSSQTVGRRLYRSYQEQEGRLVCITDEEAVVNPFGCYSAYAYFRALFRKSSELPGALVLCFLRRLDAESLESILK